MKNFFSCNNPNSFKKDFFQVFLYLSQINSIAKLLCLRLAFSNDKFPSSISLKKNRYLIFIKSFSAFRIIIAILLFNNISQFNDFFLNQQESNNLLNFAEIYFQFV